MAEVGLRGARAALERGDLAAALPAYAALMRSAQGPGAAAIYNDVARIAWSQGEDPRGDALFERAARIAGAPGLVSLVRAGGVDRERLYLRLRSKLERDGVEPRRPTPRQVREGVLRRHFETMAETVEIAVVIPTRDRAPVLKRCLEALAQTKLPADALEVVVVDDGSRDHTETVVREAEGLPRLRYLKQPESQGPAAARNLGLAEVSAPIVLFLNDDTFVTPALLSEHLISHLATDAPEAAVLGRVDWDPAVGVSLLMRLLDADGMCFAYDDIADPDSAGWERGYTCNLSFKTEWLRAAGGEAPFDTIFDAAAGEDIELCYRLERDHGLRILYNPAAFGHHHHHITLQSFAARQGRVGAAVVRMAERHPELREKLLHSLRVDAALRATGGDEACASFTSGIEGLIESWEEAAASPEAALRVGDAPLEDSLRADLLNLYRFYLHQKLNEGMRDELARRDAPAHAA